MNSANHGDSSWQQISDDSFEASQTRRPSYRSFTSREIRDGFLGSIGHDHPFLERSISVLSHSSVESFSFRRITRKQRLELFSLALLDFFCFLCLSLPAPFFPQEAELKGVSSSISGWIFGVYSLTQFLVSPIVGKILPHVESRFLCISGMFFAGGCTVLFGILEYIPTDDSLGVTIFIVFCFVLRCALSVGCTATCTASFAITAESFPDNVGAVFGILETFTGLGMMVGPALGGVLYDYLGFKGPFIVLGGLMISFVPVIMCTLPKQDVKKITLQSQGMFRQLLKVPPAVFTLLSVVISAVIWAFLDPTLEPHLRQFDLSTTMVGLIFLLMSAFYAVSSPVWGWVADKVRDSCILIVIGFFFAAIGLVLLGPTPNIPYLSDINELWLNLLALIIIGVAISLAMVPTFEKVLDAAEKAGLEDSITLYSAVAGLWGSANALGEFLGPSLGGMAVDRFGFEWTVTVVAGMCAFMGMVLFILWISEKYCKCCQPGPLFDDDISDDEELLLEDGATDEEALNPQFIDAAEPDRHPVSC